MVARGGDARNQRAGRTFVNPADVGPHSPRGRGYSTRSATINRSMEQGNEPNANLRAHGLATRADAETKDGSNIVQIPQRGDILPLRKAQGGRERAKRISQGDARLRTGNPHQTTKICPNPAGQTNAPPINSPSQSKSILSIHASSDVKNYH